MPARVLVVLAAVAVAALCVAPAGAAPKQGKEYQMVVESPEWAGVTDGAYLSLWRRRGAPRFRGPAGQAR